MRRWLGVVVAVLGLAVRAPAATFTTATGTFTAVTTAAATTDDVMVDGAANLTISASGTLGTAVFQCQQSLDGTNWTNVQTEASALGIVCNVNCPTGRYRVNVPSGAGHTLTFRWRASKLN